MQYREYVIEPDCGHYVVTGPAGVWAEDTVQDAKAQIDELYAETEALK